MASIQEKNNKFYVVYGYKDADGEKHQKWEPFGTKPEAEKRKREIEYQKDTGTFMIPQCTTVEDLMKEFVPVYGKRNWGVVGFIKNVSLIDNYIIPLMGNMKLQDVNTRYLEKLYQSMQKMPGLVNPITKKASEHISPSTIRDVHKLLRTAFQQAVKWDLINKNPAANASVPKMKKTAREIWPVETMFYATGVCEDERLKLALNLAFSCTLRMGELLGLTWDCVDISPEAIEENRAYIYINKEVQRVSKQAIVDLEGKDILLVFPEKSKRNSTILVLKTPKTDSSVRKVFLPKSVAEMLLHWKEEQDQLKDILGNEYQDFNLVMATSSGLPISDGSIRTALHKLIKEHNLPPVVFHSLRHTSVTYKLKLNGGDLKAVQGDSGHSQINMITDVYSHIIDEDRQKNAEMFEEAFYAKKNLDPQLRKSASGENVLTVPDGVDAELLAKVLSNPEFSALLTSLAKTMKP